MKRFLLSFLLLSCAAFAQVSLTQTTLTAAVDGCLPPACTNGTSQTFVVLASLTNVNGIQSGVNSQIRTMLYVDREQMAVQSINTLLNRVLVLRGYNGTLISPHASGATVFIGSPDQFYQTDPAGSCVSTNVKVTPWINVLSGSQWSCTTGAWKFTGGPFFGIGSGTVTTTGSPAANQFAVMSGSSSITGYAGATTDTSGNALFNSVTTNGTASGSLIGLGATTVSPVLPLSSFAFVGPNSSAITAFGWQVPTAVNGSAGIVHLGAPTNSISPLSSGLIVQGDLSTQYFTGSCQSGLGDGLNAIPAGTYLQTFCFNDSSTTRTITGIKCFVDSGAASTLNASGNTLGALLTGAVTCGTGSFASGTQSANVALTNTDYIKFTFVADGTAKQMTFVVTYTQ